MNNANERTIGELRAYVNMLQTITNNLSHTINTNSLSYEQYKKFRRAVADIINATYTIDTTASWLI